MFFFFLGLTPQRTFDPVLERLESVLALTRETYPKMSVSALHTLIYLARREQRALSAEGWPLTEIAKEIGLPYASLGRNLDLLGEGVGEAKGLGLLERGIDPKNSKERRIMLTDKGVELINSFVEILKDEAADKKGSKGRRAGKSK